MLKILFFFFIIRHACISSEIFQYPRVVFSLPCSPSLTHTLHLHQENCQFFVHYCEQRLVFFKKKKKCVTECGDAFKN